MKFNDYLNEQIEEAKILDTEYGAGFPEGKRREDDIIKAIAALAKKYKVGELAHMRIDARGDIMMLQAMKNSAEYKQKEELPDNLKKIAQKYNKGYRGEVTGRWIKLNHFTWEKMLRDLRY